MVHVKKCPYEKRGKPSTEFYIDGKPQVYCMGLVDKKTDESLKECKNCLDHVRNAEIDFRKEKRNERNQR